MPTDISQDLRDARALLEQSGTADEKRKYHKAAEIILLKTLRLEPENREAKALIQSARAATTLQAATPPAPEQNEAAFSDDGVIFKSLKVNKKKRKFSLKSPIGFGVIVLVGASLIASLIWMVKSHPARHVISAVPVGQPERVKQIDFHPAPVDSQPLIEDTRNLASSLVAVANPTPTPLAAVANPTPTPASKLPAVGDPTPTPASKVGVKPEIKTPPPAVDAAHATPAPATGTGTLAVSSPTAADIFQNGQYIGSTPATLQLPAGQQMLEYRHGDLRTVVTHDIKPNELTSASITFQITVQINARPWAQVFLDGTTRRPLGQTPLSGVSVPIGGTLVFENSNFSPKTYRITEKDAAIQLNFP